MNDVDLVKQKIDIVSFIKEYATIVPAGSNFKTRCPFHQEKTPSFMISPERQSWHCFGCGLGGDVISFLEKIENLTFVEALRKLADRVGVKLSGPSQGPSGLVTKMFDALKFANEFYQAQLNSPTGKEAREYLLARGLNEETIREFGLGWSPAGWDNLIKTLLIKNYSLRELQQIGLASTTADGRGMDRFRERIMFPIADIHGSVVGFGGRILLEKESAPKYLNSPQTPLYNKSEVLYRLNSSRQEIKRLDYVILVEGYMDAIGVWQAGTKNVVAICGTALTSNQVQMLKRYTNNVMIAFDADAAGQRANLRGIDLLWLAGLNVKVIVIPKGKDPDELARKDPEAWRLAIKNAKSYMDYAAELIFSQFDLTKLEQKKAAATKLVALLGYLNDPVERDHYLRLYAARLGSTEAALSELVSRQQKKDTNNDSETTALTRQPLVPELPLTIRASESLLAILLNDKDFDFNRINYLEARWLPAGQHRDLYEYAKMLYAQTGLNSIATVPTLSLELATLNDNCQLLFVADYESLSVIELQQEGERLASFLADRGIKQRKLEIINLLRSAEKTGNQEQISSLVAESIELDRLMAQLS
jgi:DNA primase